MKIKLTFDDGSSEFRDPESPCLPYAAPHPRAPHMAGSRCFRGRVHIDGQPALDLHEWLGGRVAVWVILGQDEHMKALAGEWRMAHVESTEEMLARLEYDYEVLLRENATLSAEKKMLGEALTDSLERRLKLYAKIADGLPILPSGTP